MMDVVSFRVVEFDAAHVEGNVVSCVIDPSQEASHSEKNDGTDDVDLTHITTGQIEGKHVVVLAKEELNRVYIDRINVGPAWCLLRMMVLVNEAIDCFDVKEPV